MASSPAMTSSTNSSSSNSSCGGNKRKLCAPDGLPGAMRESNNDGNDHFFQPHLKSQVCVNHGMVFGSYALFCHLHESISGRKERPDFIVLSLEDFAQV